MDSKKISFGFSKLAKKPNIFGQSKKETKVELIDCLEGQSIKIKDAIEKVKEPLSIPMQGAANSISRRIIESRKEEKKIIEDDRPDSELTLDELATRELLREAKVIDNTEDSSKIKTLPAVKDVLVIKGKEEPTLEDYENVPISDYGLAMLRGMGWKDGMGIGKNQRNVVTVEPELRPKGMGLGVNKLANIEKPKDTDKKGEELILKKNAYAKIIAGHHKGCYCQVQGLDDEAGRVIVKTAIKNLILSLNEFLLIPITKEEYIKSSKVINNAKYEKYKEGRVKVENDERDHKKTDKYKELEESSSHHKKSYKRSKYRKDSSDESEYERRHRKEKKKKHHKHRRGSSNDSDNCRETDYRKRKSKK